MIRVYTDMVADLFHRGHVEFLKKAKGLFPKMYLVVGIHSDADVAKYKRFPVYCMEDRIEIVRACRYVDEVLPNAPLSITQEWLAKHNIQWVTHAGMTDYLREVNYKVPIDMGIMLLLPYYEGISTTDIMNRIKQDDS